MYKNKWNEILIESINTKHDKNSLIKYVKSINFKYNSENDNKYLKNINNINIDNINRSINLLFKYLNTSIYLAEENNFLNKFLNIILLLINIYDKYDLERFLIKHFTDDNINIKYFTNILINACFINNFTIKLNINNIYNIWDKNTKSSKNWIINRIIILKILNIFIDCIQDKNHLFFIFTKNKLNLQFIISLLYSSVKYDNYSKIPYWYLLTRSNENIRIYSELSGKLFNKLFFIKFKDNIVDYEYFITPKLLEIFKEIYKRILIIIRSPYDITNLAFFGSYSINPLIKNCIITLYFLLKSNNFFIGLLFNDKKNYSILVGLIFLGFEKFHNIEGIQKFLRLIYWELFSNNIYLSKLNYKIEESIEINKILFNIGYMSNFILNFFLIKLEDSLKKQIFYEIEFHSTIIYKILNTIENIDDINSFYLFKLIKYNLSDFRYIKNKIFSLSLIKLISGIEVLFLYKFHKNHYIIKHILWNKNIIINLSKLYLDDLRIKNILKNKLSEVAMTTHIEEIKKLFWNFSLKNYIELIIFINNENKYANEDLNYISNEKLFKEFITINLPNIFDYDINKNDIFFNNLKLTLELNLNIN